MPSESRTKQNSLSTFKLFCFLFQSNSVVGLHCICRTSNLALDWTLACSFGSVRFVTVTVM